MCLWPSQALFSLRKKLKSCFMIYIYFSPRSYFPSSSDCEKKVRQLVSSLASYPCPVEKLVWGGPEALTEKLDPTLLGSTVRLAQGSQGRGAVGSLSVPPAGSHTTVQ